MERLTKRERNYDGTAISEEPLIYCELPSEHCSKIVTKLADYEDLEDKFGNSSEQLTLMRHLNELKKKLNKARFPITSLKQDIKINGIQQTDDVILYTRAIEIIDEIITEISNSQE